MDEKLLTQAEYMKRKRIGHARFKELSDLGLIPYARFGRRLYIPEAALSLVDAAILEGRLTGGGADGK